MINLAMFEIRSGLRKPSTYIYLILYTLLGALWTLAYVGAAPGMDISLGPDKLLANSPYVLNQVIALTGLFGVFTLAGVMGRAGAKDFLFGTGALIFSKPISRLSYLGGRFLGALGLLLIAFAGIPLGAWVAVHSGLAAPEMIGPHITQAYIAPMLMMVFPNLFSGGAFFFSLTALTRRMTAVYVGSVVLLLGWLIASGMSGDATSLYALLDPTGIFAVDQQTVYWSLAEKNSRPLQFTGALLWNRLLWMGIGCACLATAFRFFSTTAKESVRKSKQVDATTPKKVVLPVVKPVFGAAAHRLMWTRIARFELKATIANRYFAAILTCGALFMLQGSFEIGALMGADSYPVTWQVLEKVRDGFGLIILMIIAYYSGELVHRERDVRIAPIYDALPTPNWIPFTAKLTGLASMVAALLGVLFVCGVSIQLMRGWTELNLPLYAMDLLVIQFSRMVLICVLAMFIHVVVNHKSLGHVVMALYFLITMAVLSQGAGHPLVLFAWAPPAPWSDMNGFGAALAPHLAYKAYWLVFSVIPVLFANAIWTRGTSLALKTRLRRIKPSVMTVAAGIAVFWLAFGAFLYHQDSKRPFQTRNTRLSKAASLEQEFGAYRSVLNFSVTDADYQIDLYPTEGKLHMQGRYTLENRHQQTLDLVLIHAGDFLNFGKLAPDVAHEQEVDAPQHGFYVFKLDQPVGSGGVITVSFAYDFEKARLPSYLASNQLYRNGTFLERDFFPMTGFPEMQLLEDESTRQRFGLPPRRTLPKADDLSAASRSGLGGDTTWVNMRALVSTDLDQIPMVPAPMVSSYEEEGRRMALFDTGDEQVLFWPTLTSARYEVAQDRWEHVELGIYHHPQHDQNIDRMMRGLKRSLAYCTEAFGSYPHDYLRILEFPRLHQYAQSLAGTIPFSESLGFIADIDDEDPDEIDFPFFATAHEAAHQWWPHQVIPADAKGANMLSEALAQYTALKILEREIGKEAMKPILGLQRHMYLSGRADLDRDEPALFEVEEEDFIYYYKGGLALYTLADRIGEDRVNEALRLYLAEFGGRSDRFPLTTDLIRLLRQTGPADYHYLIEDWFMHVTFGDLRLKSAVRRSDSDGSEKLVVAVYAEKLRAHGLGEQTTVPMNDEVTFTFLNAEGELIATKTAWLQDGDQEVVFPVAGEVVEVVIDPYFGVMDRVLEDNRIVVKEE